MNRAVKLIPQDFHARFYQGAALNDLRRHKEALPRLTKLSGSTASILSAISTKA